MRLDSVHWILAIAATGWLALSPDVALAQNVDDEVARALDEANRALGDADAALEGVAPIRTYQASYECSKQQNLVIDGKAFKEGKTIGGKKVATVIDAHGHCNLLLRNLEITGVVAIEAHGHANVRLEDSAISAQVAIHAHGHANVRIVDSTIAGNKAAIKMNGHANLTVDKKSKVKGRVKKGRFNNYVKVK